MPNTAQTPANEFSTPTFSRDSDLEQGTWNGSYQCPFEQYTAQFPHADVAVRLHLSGYKDSAVILTRVDYGMGMMANIVMSSLPDGRTADVELSNQLDLALAHEKALGRSMNIEPVMTEKVGPLLCLAITDVVPSPAEGPYPLVMAFVERKGPARTVSVHRIFVVGTNRFEVAVLQQLPVGLEPSLAHEKQMFEQVTDIATQIIRSMA